MFAFKSLAAKYSGAMALALVIFSAGFVVVHACHSDQVTQVSATVHHQTLEQSSGSITGSNSLVANVCTAAFFVVLLVSRKYLLKKSSGALLRVKSQIFLLGSVIQRPPNLKYALSLSQLGVIRI
jgi:hypothetical protein